MWVAVETGVTTVVDVDACGKVGAGADEVGVTSGTVVFATTVSSVLVVQVVLLSTAVVSTVGT